MHEASSHPHNCFITLTYNNKHIPEHHTLNKRAFPLFMRRLRKRLDTESEILGWGARYFHCGEYGDELDRPHYHAILFGIDFRDKKQWKFENGSWAYRSETLEKLWKYGHSEIKDVTYGRAQYVARYVTKKVTGKKAKEYYGKKEPEFATMSRRPGIGSEWFKKFGREVYPNNRVVMDGKPQRPPRYYDKLLEADNPEMLKEMQKERKKWKNPDDETEERRQVREECARARINNLTTRSV